MAGFGSVTSRFGSLSINAFKYCNLYSVERRAIIDKNTYIDGGGSLYVARALTQEIARYCGCLSGSEI